LERVPQLPADRLRAAARRLRDRYLAVPPRRRRARVGVRRPRAGGPPLTEVAVVVGAAGGIGATIAEHLLETDPSLRCGVVDLASGWSSPLVARFGADRVVER